MKRNLLRKSILLLLEVAIQVFLVLGCCSMGHLFSITIKLASKTTARVYMLTESIIRIALFAVVKKNQTPALKCRQAGMLQTDEFQNFKKANQSPQTMKHHPSARKELANAFANVSAFSNMTIGVCKRTNFNYLKLRRVESKLYTEITLKYFSRHQPMQSKPTTTTSTKINID